MSEYQYYEFQAIDRPLTEQEMSELRSYSSRAVITPTRFVNHYQWGSFKGNSLAWMEKYFDAFIYVANWGAHESDAPPSPDRAGRGDGAVVLRQRVSLGARAGRLRYPRVPLGR